MCPCSAALTEPGDRFDVILLDAAAVGVHPSEVALRAGETLLCGFAEPGDRFSVIQRDAFAISIHEPEEILHRGITLLCVRTEDGFDVILRTRDAIHATEFVLRGGIALLGRLLQPCDCFNVIQRVGVLILRGGIALPCGLALPSNGFSVILRNAAAVDVPHLEVELRLDVALLRGFAVPSDGFSVILRDAFAISIHVTEVELRGGVALLGGFTVPSDGFSVILRDAAAIEIHVTELELRLDVAMLRGFAVPGDGFDVILRNAFAGGIPQPEEILRRGRSSLGAGAQTGEFLCCRSVTNHEFVLLNVSEKSAASSSSTARERGGVQRAWPVQAREARAFHNDLTLTVNREASALLASTTCDQQRDLAASVWLKWSEMDVGRGAGVTIQSYTGRILASAEEGFTGPQFHCD